MIYTMKSGRNEITINTETGDISGGTYPMRAIIKEEFAAKWDADRRVWHADDLAETIEKYKDYLTRVYKLDEKIDTPKEEKKPVKMNARLYDLIFNEGGEGYNPYRYPYNMIIK